MGQMDWYPLIRGARKGGTRFDLIKKSLLLACSMPPGQATDRNTPMTRWHGLKRLWRSDVHSMFEISQDFGSRVAEGPHVPAPGAQNAAGGSTQWGPRPARAGSPGLLAASPSRPAFKNVQLRAWNWLSQKCLHQRHCQCSKPAVWVLLPGFQRTGC